MFSVLKQSKEEANKKGKYFWIFELQLKNQKDKVKLQLEMKNKNKTTTRIKLNKAKTKTNNKNIFGILGFGKINNTSRNKQEKTKHEYTENWHEANVEMNGLSVYAYLPQA